jgi:hypothetical protein
MRTILFIGGFAADKLLFALVNEDPTTEVRRCHIFRAPEPVWIQGCRFYLMLAVDCYPASHSNHLATRSLELLRTDEQKRERYRYRAVLRDFRKNRENEANPQIVSQIWMLSMWSLLLTRLKYDPCTF